MPRYYNIVKPSANKAVAPAMEMKDPSKTLPEKSTKDPKKKDSGGEK